MFLLVPKNNILLCKCAKQMVMNLIILLGKIWISPCVCLSVPPQSSIPCGFQHALLAVPLQSLHLHPRCRPEDLALSALSWPTPCQHRWPPHLHPPWVHLFSSLAEHALSPGSQGLPVYLHPPPPPAGQLHRGARGRGGPTALLPAGAAGAGWGGQPDTALPQPAHHSAVSTARHWERRSSSLF